jgi:hypothetical protein
MSLLQLNDTQSVLIWTRFAYKWKLCYCLSAPSLLMSTIACELIAKLCFWVFFFATLHLPYSDYYLSTLTRHVRVSWKANFCVFSRDLFRDSRRNELIEPWGVARLHPLTGHTRCGSRARVGRYLVGRLADVESSLPCRHDVRPVSENMTAAEIKTPFFPRIYTREVNSEPMTGKSHF